MENYFYVPNTLGLRDRCKNYSSRRPSWTCCAGAPAGP